MLGGCALGLATGWNVANTGAVAQPLATAYGVGLATVGLFTTALFVTHLALQIPGGKASDRFGPRRVGLLGLVLIAVFSALSLIAHDTALTLVDAGPDRHRHRARLRLGQRLRPGAGRLPFRAGPLRRRRACGWRARPRRRAAGRGLDRLARSLRDVALRCARGSPGAGGEPARRSAARGTRGDASRRSGILRDTRLYSLAVLYAASLGLSIVIGNWIVTLLHRQGGLDKGSAGAIGALTLALGIVTRPLGGWIMHARPERMRAAVGASLLAGAVGTLLLAAAKPPALVAARGGSRRSRGRNPLRAGVHRRGAGCGRTPRRQPSGSSTARRASSRSWARRCSASRSRSRVGAAPGSSSSPACGSAPSSLLPSAARLGAAPATCSDAIAVSMISAARAASAGSACLGRVVADPVLARDEDHRGRDAVGDAHRVVRRAGVHPAVRLARRGGRLLERAHDPLVHRRRGQRLPLACTPHACRVARALGAAYAAISRATPR